MCIVWCAQVWTVDKELKGWPAAQKKFFDAGQVGGALAPRCTTLHNVAPPCMTVVGSRALTAFSF
jgi:hypothetical protein